MRTIKQLSFIALALVLALTSCTVEKRVYMSGYHIEWKKSKHEPDKLELAGSDKEKQSGQSQSLEAESSDATARVVEHTSTPIDVNEVAPASVIENAVAPAERQPVLAPKMESVVKNSQFSDAQTFVKQSADKPESSQSGSAAGAGKSQLIALLLCIFVGILGIHRFYLGHIGIGIIQLLTLGGCGIWSLIDLIMIITGDLKPKDGDYDEKL